MRDRHILNLANQSPWAILPAKLEMIAALLERHANGARLSPEAIQAQIGGGRRSARATRRDRVAVIPISGVLFPRRSLLTEISGGTDLQSFSRELRSAMAARDVSAIVLDVDSPGGLVHGVPEAAAQIYRARAHKPIIAVANHTMASAAYWLASQASEVVAAPSAEVGSIGVLALHVDVSEADKKAGVRPTYITSTKHKAEANPHEPLSAEAREHVQGLVDADQRLFSQAVARGRGIRVSIVRGATYGEGRVYGAESALRRGMIDHVLTFDETVARLLRDR